jgi:hypothetical protein
MKPHLEKGLNNPSQRQAASHWFPNSGPQPRFQPIEQIRRSAAFSLHGGFCIPCEVLAPF